MHNLVTPNAALEDAYATLLTDIKEAIIDELIQYKEEEQQAIRDGNYHQVDFCTAGLFEDVVIGIRSKLRQSRIMQQTFEAYDQAAVA